MPSVVVAETPLVVFVVRRGRRGGEEDGSLLATLRGGVQKLPVAVGERGHLSAVLVIRRREDDPRSLPGHPVQEQPVTDIGPLRQESRRPCRTVDRLGFCHYILFTIWCVRFVDRFLFFVFCV